MAKIASTICSFEGCYNTICAKGYCTKHYWRLYKHGDANVVLPNPPYWSTEKGRKWLRDNCRKWVGNKNFYWKQAHDEACREKRTHLLWTLEVGLTLVYKLSIPDPDSKDRGRLQRKLLRQASRVRKEFPDRKFRTKQLLKGVLIWRVV